MNFLAIDTSGKRLVAAAARGERAEIVRFESEFRHSVLLAEAMEEALGRVGLRPAACDFFACVTGPGSFTGIRIGVSTVKGLCFALDKPALGVTSLDCLAYAEEERDKVAVIDAGHGNVYAKGYGAGRELAAAHYPFGEVQAFAAAHGCKLVDERADGAEGLLRAVRANAALAGPARSLAAEYLRRSSAEEGR